MWPTQSPRCRPTSMVNMLSLTTSIRQQVHSQVTLDPPRPKAIAVKSTSPTLSGLAHLLLSELSKLFLLWGLKGGHPYYLNSFENTNFDIYLSNSWVFISISRHFDEDGNDDGTLRLRSFLGLYIFALFYELALSYDALRRRNTFQLVGLCVCNFGLFVYGIVQMREIRQTIDNLSGNTTSGNQIWQTYHLELIMIPVFIGICTVLMIFVTWRLRAEFSWTIYQSMSADLQMNRRYTTYQVRSSVLRSSWIPVNTMS